MTVPQRPGYTVSIISQSERRGAVRRIPSGLLGVPQRPSEDAERCARRARTLRVPRATAGNRYLTRACLSRRSHRKRQRESSLFDLLCGRQHSSLDKHCSLRSLWQGDPLRLKQARSHSEITFIGGVPYVYDLRRHRAALSGAGPGAPLQPLPFPRSGHGETVAGWPLLAWLPAPVHHGPIPGGDAAL